eukprot:6178944-Pleurochrysis_carterae.AAC.4
MHTHSLAFHSGRKDAAARRSGGAPVQPGIWYRHPLNLPCHRHEGEDRSVKHASRMRDTDTDLAAHLQCASTCVSSQS